MVKMTRLQADRIVQTLLLVRLCRCFWERPGAPVTRVGDGHPVTRALKPGENKTAKEEEQTCSRSLSWHIRVLLPWDIGASGAAASGPGVTHTVTPPLRPLDRTELPNLLPWGSGCQRQIMGLPGLQLVSQFL